MSEKPELSPAGDEQAPDQPQRDVLAGVRRTLGLDQGEGLQDTDARLAMVEFRTFKSGWTALTYKSLIEVTLEKNKDWPLTVIFSDRVVKIQGSNMEGLYLSLVRQRAMVVMEQDDRHDLDQWGGLFEADERTKGRIFIASIQITNRSKGKSSRG